jgi:stage II sporulation protein P
MRTAEIQLLRPRLFGKKTTKLILSLLTLTFIFILTVGLPHTGALRWLDGQMTALARVNGLVETALASEWTGFYNPAKPGWNDVLRAQTAALTAFIPKQIEDTSHSVAVRERDAAISRETIAEPEVFRPRQYANPPVPSPVRNPDFVPDRRASMIREGTFVPATAYDSNTFGRVFINNNINAAVDVDSLLEKQLSLAFKPDMPQILIIHTHASEAYFPCEDFFYTPTDIERTEDTAYNVVRIGDELKHILTEKGFNVLHDRNIYDFPTFSGSYRRALESITEYLDRYPDIAMVIDIHRDSITTEEGLIYKAVTDVNGEKTAQMMLVMGTDIGGLPHPDWRENLALGVQLQKAIADRYPTLMRPIYMRRDRFNQHATTGSLLLEVGTSGNSMTEALRAIHIFGDILGDFLHTLA